MENINVLLKEDLMRLVEVQIAARVDLTPEEMVEQAIVIMDRINTATCHLDMDVEQEASEVQFR